MNTKLNTILSTEGLKELRPCFEAEAITDANLFSLTDTDLIHIGIAKLGHRKQILQAIERTKTEEKLFSKMIFVEGGRLPDSSLIVKDFCEMGGFFSSLKDDHEEMPDEEEVAPPEAAISVEPEPSDSAEPEGKTFSLFSVPDFFIAQFPVTLAEWDYVRVWGESHGYELPIGRSSGPNCPVTHIDIYEMMIWCNARSEMCGLNPEYMIQDQVYRNRNQPDACDPKPAWSNGFRLPSEQEWEWAARGGTHARTYRSEKYRYAGSDDVSRVAASGHGPQPVGTKDPNELGLYDMSGNVWEVVWSLRNKFSVYPRIRGGSLPWDESCTITYRQSEPHGKDPNEGFRVARDVG